MRYVALFRGINVGGKNRIKMDKLKELFLDLGFEQVKTYIQSGNVVFDSNLEEALLYEKIHLGFLDFFGVDTKVILRNETEFQILYQKNPISEEEISQAVEADGTLEHLYLYFLETVPDQEKIKQIWSGYEENDIMRVGEKELYFLCYQSIRTSKLAARMTKAFPMSTVRNWKTVHKLYEMLKE